ncbi:MAG: flagellar export protein FliJ [Candidatus Zixiibacteriota bacterium]|nr:MAG: flagellar export protein FliJ [candidate division Zixibacteria bacterium]
MKKFKFRLQTLLRVKEHIEKQHQKELAEATQQVLRQVKELEAISHKSENTLEAKRQKQTNNVSVAELLVYSRYLLKLRRDNLAGRELMSALQTNERKKRKKLLEASREKKVYEKLKEHDQERFNNDAEAMAHKEADEIGLNIYRLRQKQ